MKFTDDEEAVKKLNSLKINGLWTSVYTKNVETANRYSKNLRCGTVSINCNHQSETLPFGGCGASGFGREGGVEGLSAYSETKVITMPYVSLAHGS